MNMTIYALDADLARKSDDTKTRIDASGEYVGKFTKAKRILSANGTEGIEFSFETENGETGDYLTLYTIKANGAKTFGYNMLMALMTCLRIRQIGTQRITVDEWDTTTRRLIPIEASHYTELMNKPVGVLIQREPIIDQHTGQIKIDAGGVQKWKLNLVGFFDAESRKTASEILDKVDAPSRLQKKIATLRDKPIPTPISNSTSAPASAMPAVEEDDIPF
jgi:hypothetical protein